MIVLLGLPASGKSTVGRNLAQQLDVPFIDCDKVIEEEAGCTIPEYFDYCGEDGFRKLETRVLRSLLERYHGQPAVLSTGGGVVVTPENCEMLKADDTLNIIYILQQPEELVKRLRDDGSRPLLAGENKQDKLRALFNTRDPLYRDVAHHILPCYGRSARRAASDIRQILNLWQPPSAS